jgi:hypothetical protein
MAFWPTKSEHPPVSKDVLARSLDGYRVGVKLTVRFRSALDDDAAEIAVDEIARAATHVLGDQLSQGRVPLTKDELAAAVNRRLSPATSKVAEFDVDVLEMIGQRQSGQQSARPQRPSVTTSPTSPPASRAPTPSDASAQFGDRSSGSSLAAPPRTLWLIALSQCAPGTSVNEVANLLGLALRDSTAAVLLRALLLIDPVVVDRLALFHGHPPMSALRTATCACLAAGFCRALLTDGCDGESAARLSEGAASHALASVAPTREQIRSYFTSEAPVRELARRTASTLGTPNDAPAIQSALSPYCEALRVQFAAVDHNTAVESRRAET